MLYLINPSIKIPPKKSQSRSKIGGVGGAGIGMTTVKDSMDFFKAPLTVFSPVPGAD